MDNIEVTVLIAEYNTEWDKLKKSVSSAIKQKDVRFEIIVCDDGSRENWFNELLELFKESGFSEYRLLTSESNPGTIKNVLKAKDYARGKYIWPFGAGDYIHDENVLRRWVDCCNENSALVSFGDLVYYRSENGSDVPAKVKPTPKCLKLFAGRKQSRNRQLYDYLLCNDHICGAVWLTETETFFKYSLMMEDRVIYADDDRFRLTLFDGIPFLYHNEKVLYYETGVGVSTANQDEWNKKLKKDHIEANRILCEIKPNGGFEKRIQRYYRATLDEERSKVRTLQLFLAFPEYIWLWVVNKLS